MKLTTTKLAAATIAALGLALTSCNSTGMEETMTRYELETTEIRYDDNGTALKGYLARPRGLEGTAPGVIVVHEWWGHNEYAQRRARDLAKLGYVAFALDMYGEGKVADHPDDAGTFMTAVMGDSAVMQSRFNAALAVLKQQEGVDTERTGAIGYCMGGGVVLAMARADVGLDAVASFHGSLGAAMGLGDRPVTAQALVCTGGADPFVPAETVASFQEEWDRVAIAPYNVMSFPGAVHGFTNPEADVNGEKFGLPLAYDENADVQSWNALKEMFADAFAVKPPSER